MQDYKISKAQSYIFKIINKLKGKNISECTQEEIDEQNNMIYPKGSLVKKILNKPSKNIEVTSYIIPVDDGAITGYLYEKEKSRMMSLKPLIIFYHGGGWVRGNMSIYDVLASYIADVCNATVLMIDYRLAPRYKFPTALEDCYSALLWAFDGCKYWKVDPDKIYLFGDSAGANLAASVSKMARDKKGPKIAGQILAYPATDARMRTQSYLQHKETPTLSAKDMEFFINAYKRESSDLLDPLFSPLLAKDFSRLPATLLFTAEYDPLRDDGFYYAKALESADTKVRYIECKEAFHAYLNYPLAQGTDLTISCMRQFITGRSLEAIQEISLKTLLKSKH